MKMMTPSLVSLVILIIFASVVEQTRASICVDNLGHCNDCDQRCKAKHGASGISRCDGPVGMSLCTCSYECPKFCRIGLGNCGESCNDQCCDAKCAQSYNSGHGICDTHNEISLCQCKYPCSDPKTRL
ncbi:PREDICTED: defensin-like protein 181 [Camelina sativa]|uniref:Defensin-like protein n=1 Tax=Camelina sativa TaxID=90675 RepID=A0ABM0WPX6_CAMSA|nr:PREDICTED: defensin-like protein 181 [Camelina sativa]